MDSGDKWNNVLMKFVDKTDITQERYRRLQNKLKVSVENIIRTNIYGNLKGKLAKPVVQKINISFNDKLLDDFVGALKPNQLIIDTELELQQMLSKSQIEIRDKHQLQKQYDLEMRALLPL
ncbi:unnamed protein product, partial [Oppiella nova]